MKNWTFTSTAKIIFDFSTLNPTEAKKKKNLKEKVYIPHGHNREMLHQYNTL